VKFWQSVSFAEPEQLVEVARIAEDVGFHGILVSDHLFFPEKLESKYPYSEDGSPPFGPETHWPESWAAISAMAAVTERIRFATMVYILPLHHPLEVAKVVGTAALFSGNRVILGAGAGWMREEFAALGVDFATRGRRFDESIEVLRRLWTGEMVEFHGEIFDFDRIQMSPAPTASIPIFIGGASKPALRRAIAHGDAYYGFFQTVDATEQLIATIRDESRTTERPAELGELPITTTPPPGLLDRDTVRRYEDLGVERLVVYAEFADMGRTAIDPGSSEMDAAIAHIEKQANDLAAG